MARSVTVKDVMQALEQFAPLPLQEDWDNAGLQIGLTEADVSGALLCLDVTEAIVDEAVERGFNLVVAHHPLLFKGLKCISDADTVQRTATKAIQRSVNIIAMHTNMDNARGGVNWKMAEKLGLVDVRFLSERRVGDITCGSAVIGTLSEAMPARAFIDIAKRAFGAETALCNEPVDRPIRRVALCGGAGDFLLNDAIRAGADAFITGEMHYHVYFGHENEIQICVLGHYQTEQYTAEIFQDIIHSSCPGVPTAIARTCTNPIKYL